MHFIYSLTLRRKENHTLRMLDSGRVVECHAARSAPFRHVRIAFRPCQGLTWRIDPSRPEHQHAELFSRKHELVQDRSVGDNV